MKNVRQIFSLSGLCSGYTKEIYNQLAERLPHELPEFKDRFVFLGSPFAQSGLSFPLKLTEQENCQHVTTRLLRCWMLIDDFNHTTLMPAFEAGKIPIVLRYGLDAYLYACHGCEPTNAPVLQRLEAAHKALVQLRVIEEDIPPPQYLIPWLPSGTLDDAQINGSKVLSGVDAEQLSKFRDREEILIQKYCSPARGQKRPWWLEDTSIETMCTEAIRAIRKTMKHAANEAERARKSHESLAPSHH